MLYALEGSAFLKVTLSHGLSKKYENIAMGERVNELARAVKKYNEYRQHASLKGSTPMQYIQNIELEAAA